MARSKIPAVTLDHPLGLLVHSRSMLSASPPAPDFQVLSRLRRWPQPALPTPSPWSRRLASGADEPLVSRMGLELRVWGQLPGAASCGISWARFPSANNRMRRETQDMKLQVGDVCEVGARRQKFLEGLEHLT